MPKTISEINEKIKQRNAVVLTAEEIIEYVGENGIEKTATGLRGSGNSDTFEGTFVIGPMEPALGWQILWVSISSGFTMALPPG